MNIEKLVQRSAVVVALLCLVGVAKAQGVQPWDSNILQWVAPTTCTSGQPVANCAVTGYRVERSATATGTFASVGTSTTTGFTHTSAPAGQNCYRVVALSAKGESVPSNVACKTNTQPSGPPNPPTDLVVVEPIAYNVIYDRRHHQFVRGYVVGRVDLGTPCGAYTVSGAYHQVPRKAVSPRPARGSMTVARCA